MCTFSRMPALSAAASSACFFISAFFNTSISTVCFDSRRRRRSPSRSSAARGDRGVLAACSVAARATRSKTRCGHSSVTYGHVHSYTPLFYPYAYMRKRALKGLACRSRVSLRQACMPRHARARHSRRLRDMPRLRLHQSFSLMLLVHANVENIGYPQWFVHQSIQ